MQFIPFPLFLFTLNLHYFSQRPFKPTTTILVYIIYISASIYSKQYLCTWNMDLKCSHLIFRMDLCTWISLLSTKNLQRRSLGFQ